MKKLICIFPLLFISCTGQLVDSFRYQQADELFSTNTEINTKIDLLWVVDNSSSMDIAQKEIRSKLANFAQTYLSPNWDIRVAVITTDTYLANPVFQNYIGRTVSGSVGYRSKHLSDLILAKEALGKTPANDEQLQKLQQMGVSLSSYPQGPGIFTLGFSNGDFVPAWKGGSQYARLLAGTRDGPIAGLCFERQPYFLSPNSSLSDPLLGPDCAVRDSGLRVGVTSCLNPGPGQDSVSECVNTALNDTVRSGRPVIETRMPEQSSGSTVSQWTQQLVNDFMVNISVGSSGSGSERGLGSLLEFINVNESSPEKFFRKGSVRAIVFLSDEDDQTMLLPDPLSNLSQFSPTSDYQCDLDVLVEANQDKFVNARNYLENDFKYCCANGCLYKNLGCEEKVVDGESFKVGVCPAANKLHPLEDIKSTVDNFFKNLDQSEKADYFVVAITPNNAAVIDQLRLLRFASDDKLDNLPFYSSTNLVTQKRVRVPAVDLGKRYQDFAQSVGNGSLSFDFGSQDYSAVLDSIGQSLLDKKRKFTLKFAPTQKEDMIVKIVHQDKSETILRTDQYEFQDKVLIISDDALVLSLKDTDRLNVNYQPSSLD